MLRVSSRSESFSEEGSQSLGSLHITLSPSSVSVEERTATSRDLRPCFQRLRRREPSLGEVPRFERLVPRPGRLLMVGKTVPSPDIAASFFSGQISGGKQAQPTLLQDSQSPSNWFRIHLFSVDSTRPTQKASRREMPRFWNVGVQGIGKTAACCRKQLQAQTQPSERLALGPRNWRSAAPGPKTSRRASPGQLGVQLSTTQVFTKHPLLGCTSDLARNQHKLKSQHLHNTSNERGLLTRCVLPLSGRP